MAQKPSEMTNEERETWPNCAAPGCTNKSCRSLRSKYCWPHTPGTAQQALDNLRETEPQGDVVHAL